MPALTLRIAAMASPLTAHLARPARGVAKAPLPRGAVRAAPRLVAAAAEGDDAKPSPADRRSLRGPGVAKEPKLVPPALSPASKLARAAFTAALVAALANATLAPDALAARSGGRVGGSGGFSAARSAPSMARSYGGGGRRYER